METTTKEQWNAWVTSHDHAQFLQSYEWGSFQETLGRTVLRLALFEKGEITHGALAVRYPLWRRASYLYFPRGPLGSEQNWYLEQCENQKQDLFIRFEPAFKPSGLVLEKSIKVQSIQPDAEWIVDLRDGYDAVRTGMHHKTRYNIGLANKKGVQIRALEKKSQIRESDHSVFLKLLKETAKGQVFHLHPPSYYRSLMEFFLPADVMLQRSNEVMGRLYIAFVGKQPLAAIFILFFGDTAFYVHGGTARNDRDKMAPYALHAYALSDAAHSGYRYYNFGGITRSDSREHPWQGISRFKRGFGGESYLYPGTYDYPLQSIPYVLYTTGRRIWRMVHELSSFNG